MFKVSKSENFISLTEAKITFTQLRVNMHTFL